MSNDLGDIRERLAAIETTQKHHGEAINDGFDGLGKKLDAMDARMRGVETTSAKYGAIAGGIFSVGIALITQKLTGKG